MTDLSEVITPVEVRIENESEKVELRKASREALRIEQVTTLREALDAICELADEPLDELNRAQLEDLDSYCVMARRAANAVFWLIPADAYTRGDDDS